MGRSGNRPAKTLSDRRPADVRTDHPAAAPRASGATLVGMSSQIPAQPKPGAKTGQKSGPKPGTRPRPKPGSPAAGESKSKQSASASTSVSSSGSGSGSTAEEWPPREWRETTRSAGQRQALYVALAMVVMFGVLVAVNIWGAKNG